MRYVFKHIYNITNSHLSRSKICGGVMSLDLVAERVGDSKAIALDNCNKIYLLMDDDQVELMREYGYDPLITKEQSTPEEMFATLQERYEDS